MNFIVYFVFTIKLISNATFINFAISQCKTILLEVTGVDCSLQPLPCRPTSPDELGPYYMNGAPFRNETICETMTMSNTLVVSGRITDEECLHGVEAIMDIWQADEKGEYSDGKFNFACRSRIKTDPQGYYHYATVFPARYKQDGTYRPAHIHYMIKPVANGGYGTFLTQMYFKDDAFLGSKDACKDECNSADPTRHIEYKLGQDNRTIEATFNIVLKKLWNKHEKHEL